MFKLLLTKICFTGYFLLLAYSLLNNSYENSKLFSSNFNNFENQILKLTSLPNELLSKNYLKDEKILVFIVGYSYVFLATMGLFTYSFFYFLLVLSYFTFSFVFKGHCSLFENLNQNNIKEISFFIGIIGTGILLSCNQKKCVTETKDKLSEFKTTAKKK